MLYATGGGLRYFTATALLSLALTAISPSFATTSSSDSASGSEAVEFQGICGVSDGDKAFGIQVVTDTACAGGGLGCYNNHCRYCKVVDTLKSAHLESCDSYGASFATMAPLSASTGPCHVSSGDAAVGVGGVTDSSCLYGGIGCFNDHCRFCQTESTPQSSQFLLCSWVQRSSSTSGSVNVAAGDISIDTTDLFITDSSSFDAHEESVEGGVAGLCTLKATDGDAAVGINITTDVSCSYGGIGCIDSICRFCKVTNTTQSAHLNVCPIVTKLCTTTVSEGDAAVGISIISDAACGSGGLGCMDDICRLCQAKATPQSAHLQNCSDFVTFTSAPSSAATATPATLAPMASGPTLAPVMTTCKQTVSEGDAAVGIKIASDPTCAYGGLGCIDQVCRFCRVTTTVQSASFVDCSTIQSDTITSTTAPTTAPVSTTAAPTATPMPTPAPPLSTTTTTATTPLPITVAPTTAPPSLAPPVSTTAVPTTTPAPTTVASTTVPQTLAPTTTPVTTAPTSVCSIPAAAGDVAAGINIVTDTSCALGGLGCIDTVCRFCKVTTTTQSASYTDCATITGGDTQTPTVTATTPTPTPTQTSIANAAVTPSIVFECSRTVSSGDKSVGLDIVSDIRCSDGGTGCLDDVCRFCKRFDTIQSQSYINCSSIPSADVGADITFVPIPLVNDAGTPARMLLAAEATEASSSIDTTTSASNVADESYNAGEYYENAEAATASICTTTVSEGDAAVGISIITDVSCATGGLGCMSSVCRFCKTKTTDQSAHFKSCSDYLATTTPPTTAPTASTVVATAAPVSTTTSYSIPLDCYQSASSGDKNLGLDIVTDIRCGDGGVGCVDSICRFCKRFETTQSHSYLNCADIPSSDNGADITFRAITTVDDAQIQESGPSDTIVAIHESADYSLDRGEACANVSLADGQAAGGIGVVLDTAHCPEGLASGCIGDTGCRYCMRFPTNVSDYLEYCTIVNASGVAYALSGGGISVDESNSLADEDGSAVSVAVGNEVLAEEKILTDYASNQSEGDVPALAIGIAACVAIAVVVGFAVFGLKRTLKTLTKSNNSKEDVRNGDDDSRPSVLIASNIGEPGIVRDV